MRLPPDTVLLCSGEPPAELLGVWAQERLVALALPAPERLEAVLEALGATTVVVVGQEAAQAAAHAAALGFRVFWIGDAPVPEGAQAVTLAQTLAAARQARARERWRAARAPTS